METFRFIPIEKKLARHITKPQVKTDEYYERREKELLELGTEGVIAEHNDKLYRLTTWRNARPVMHLDLKKSVLSQEDFTNYLNTL